MKKNFTLKTLMTLLVMLVTVGVWADDSPWTYTIKSGDKMTEGSITINGATWTVSDKTVGAGDPSSYIGVKSTISSANSQYGLKFGNSGSVYYSSYTLSTDYFKDYNVTKVEFTVKNNGSKVGTLTVKQGTTTIGTVSNSSATSDLNTLTATGTNGTGGTLYVTYAVAQASYVNAITVYYTKSANTEAYTVKFDAGEDGTCSTTSLTEESANAGVVLPSCTASSGYRFVGWSKTNGGTTADAGTAGNTYKPTSNCTLYAVYKETYTATINTTVNGTLDVTCDGEEVGSGDEFIAGDVLTMVATPSTGYKLKSLVVNDGTTHAFSSSPKTWTMGEKSIAISANFEALAEPSIALSTVEHGTISAQVNNVDVTTAQEGTVVTLTATADDGYVFNGWTVTGATPADAESATTTLTVGTSDIVVSASFLAEGAQSTDIDITLNNSFFGSTATTNVEDTQLTGTKNNVTITIARGTKPASSDQGGKIYVNASTIRLYQYNIMKITAPYGYVVTNVEFVEPSSSKAWTGSDNTADYGTYNDDSKTWTGCASEVTITFGGTCRMAGLNITLEKEEYTAQTALSLVAYMPDSEDADEKEYYATFSSDKSTFFVNAFNDGDEINVLKASVDGSEINLAIIPNSSVALDSEKPTDYTVGFFVPAKTGVLVWGHHLDKATYYTVEGKAIDALTDNMLYPGSDTEITTPADCKYYKLTYAQYTDEIDRSTLGFYYGAADGAAFTCGAGKAYLAVPNSVTAKGFRFSDDITGINEINTETLNVQSHLYNLAGQRVDANTKGIVIMNGKKYFNK